MTFEYKVVPAPTRGKKARGVKTAADRFAKALAEAINTEAAEGWEYLRTDTLPSEERQGLTGRTTVFQNMLVFRRAADVDRDAAKPEAGSAVSDTAETAEPRAQKLAGVRREDRPAPVAPLPAAIPDGPKKDVAAE
jgi:hypothetical protein